MFQVNFKMCVREVSVVFQYYFKGLSMKFQGYSKKDFRVLHGSFKTVSRKIVGCSWRPSMIIQGSFKSVSRKLQGNVMGVSRKFQVILRYFKV